MAEGRQRDQWNHTSHLLAMLYNAFRGKSARVLAPRDFHPFAPPKPKVTLRQLKDMGLLPG
jgi:hypothetical protein